MPWRVMLILLATAGPVSAQTRAENWALCRSGPPAQAFRACTALIEAGQETTADLSLAHVRRGLAKSRTNDPAGALADFNRAIELTPNSGNAYFERGYLHLSRGEYDDAIADFTRDIGLDPGWAPAYTDRGIARYRKGDLDAAIPDWTRAIEIDPVDGPAYDYRGYARLVRKLPGALEDLNMAIGLMPANTAAYNNRALFKTRVGDTDGALADYAKSLQINDRNPRTYGGRAGLRVSLGDLDAALTDIEMALKIEARYANGYGMRADVWRMRGEIDRAIADLSQAITINPKLGQAYHTRGVLRADRQEYDAALADLRQAIAVDATDEYSPLRIWTIEARLKAPADATKSLTSVIAQQKPSEPGGWPSKLARFLSGAMSESDLLAAATAATAKETKAHQCEAYFYAAWMRLVNHDDAGAKELFNKSVGTAALDTLEFASAAAALRGR